MKSIVGLVFTLSSCILTSVSAQQIRMSEMASIEQVYGNAQEEESAISMNELGIEFGYVLYETDISFTAEESILEVENIRDYAAVYVDQKYIGSLTDDIKKIVLRAPVGKHKLQLYVENTGRITYGPDILDNSKGLFGAVSFNSKEIQNWRMLPLLIKECDVKGIQFVPLKQTEVPAFYKGTFQVEMIQDIHLDVSGWGMGEIWVNGEYMGAYWAENSLKSIQIPASALVEGKNEVVIFDLRKNSGEKVLNLSNKVIFD